jgi:hypothetical protein
MQPAQFPNVVFDRVMFPCYYTGATNSTGSHTLSMAIGFYTRNDSTFSLLTSWSGSWAGTHSGTVQSSVYGGVKLMPLTLTASTSLNEGQYYVGIWSRTTSGGANATWSQVLASQMNSNFNGLFGTSVNSSQQYTRGLGIWTTTSTALPNSIAMSQLSGTQSLALRRPLFYVASGTF